MDTECLILCSGSYLISLEFFRSNQQGLLAVLCVNLFKLFFNKNNLSPHLEATRNVFL